MKYGIKGKKMNYIHFFVSVFPIILVPPGFQFFSQIFFRWIIKFCDLFNEAVSKTAFSIDILLLWNSPQKEIEHS